LERATVTDIARIAPRLGKLLGTPLLAPDDIQTIAAKNGMVRTLRGAGLDPHALADKIEKLANQFSEAQMREICEQVRADDRRATEEEFRTINPCGLREPTPCQMVCAIERHQRQHPELWQEHERKFGRDMVGRTIGGGQYLSEKQMKWLI
jgi:hypothetical protein